ASRIGATQTAGRHFLRDVTSGRTGTEVARRLQQRAAGGMVVTRTTKSVVGLFETRDRAEQAIRELHERGFARDQISVAMRDQAESAALADDAGANDAAEAAGTGAIGGGILGGMAGLLIGIGALTVPGIGPVLAAGP